MVSNINPRSHWPEVDHKHFYSLTCPWPAPPWELWIIFWCYIAVCSFVCYLGLDRQPMSYFEVSPCGRYIAFRGQYGYTNIISTAVSIFKWHKTKSSNFGFGQFGQQSVIGVRSNNWTAGAWVFGSLVLYWLPHFWVWAPRLGIIRIKCIMSCMFEAPEKSHNDVNVSKVSKLYMYYFTCHLTVPFWRRGRKCKLQLKCVNYKILSNFRLISTSGSQNCKFFNWWILS